MRGVILFFALVRSGHAFFMGTPRTRPTPPRLMMKGTQGTTSVVSRSELLQMGAGLMVLGSLAPVARAEESLIFPNVSEPAFTSTCFLELESNGKSLGRVEVSLYGDVAPKTASNFERLCAGEGGVSYKGSSVFRILKDFQISAGDIGSKKRGAAGKSSFGEPFARESFRVQHSMEGLVSMINDPKGQNDSRFFVLMTQDGGWADNRYVAFGRVTKGMDVLRQVEKMDVSSPSNAPNRPITISDSGVVPK